MSNTYTIISCHFGDLFWISQLAKRVEKYSLNEAVPELVLVNQDRSSESRIYLAKLARVKKVLEFPIDTGLKGGLGHDHPAALNRAVRSDFTTTHLIILDSDCFPLSNDWIRRIESILSSYEAIVAADPVKWGLSHPCFMVVPNVVREKLDFAEGINEVGIDSGRLVGLQLVRAGLKTYFDRPQPVFSGMRGHFYLQGSLYHHGYGSFISSSKDILRSQVREGIERFFRSKVESGHFGLTKADYVRLGLTTAWNIGARYLSRGR